ncbi:hypothetical protein [Aeropyrum pernix]|uniref:hypothetical protein n=1 Tax=Aeropyrum pernix TaxID=56636 RepID=UPI0013F1619D|nr:hypothetical protein [Aeropyrum pernix]
MGPGILIPAIERLGRSEVVEISARSSDLEWGRRRPEYSIFWWPGRRLVGAVRAVLAALSVPDPGVVVDAVDGRGFEKIRSYTSGKLIVDPFSGGGTIPLEASRMGYKAIGLDSNPYAVSVSKASSTLLDGRCRGKAVCLLKAAQGAWRKVSSLWCGDWFCIIHILLARCPPCEAPAWVSRWRDGSYLVLDEGGLKTVSGIRVSPTKPRVSLPEGLPEEAPGYVAYAAEVLTPRGRRWVYLGDGELGGMVAKYLRSTLPAARSLTEALSGFPVPPGKETSKLLASGISDFKYLYTPRQLATISAFLGEAAQADCSLEAACIAGSSSRAASLLAMYYQPARRVNLAFVLKTYWLPKNPVELNPLANTCMPETPRIHCKPVGRGGIWGLITRYIRGCGESGSSPEFRVWDSHRGLPEGIRPYAVVTDPPYPGMQSYGQLSLVYSLPHVLSGLPAPHSWNEIDSMSRSYVEDLSRSLSASGSRVESGGYMVLLLSSGTNRGATIIARLVYSLVNDSLNLVTILPFAGESPGRLGRSLNKVVYVVVFKRGTPYSRNPLEPLEWTAEVAEAAGYGPKEASVSREIASILASKLEDLLETSS